MRSKPTSTISISDLIVSKQCKVSNPNYFLIDGRIRNGILEVGHGVKQCIFDVPGQPVTKGVFDGNEKTGRDLCRGAGHCLIIIPGQGMTKGDYNAVRWTGREGMNCNMIDDT